MGMLPIPRLRVAYRLMKVFGLTIAESWPGTLQYIEKMYINLWILDSTRSVSEAIIVFLIKGTANYLLSIAYHRQIGIVCNYHNLAVFFRLFNTGNEKVVNRLIV